MASSATIVVMTSAASSSTSSVPTITTTSSSRTQTPSLSTVVVIDTSASNGGTPRTSQGSSESDEASTQSALPCYHQHLTSSINGVVRNTSFPTFSTCVSGVEDADFSRNGATSLPAPWSPHSSSAHNVNVSVSTCVQTVTLAPGFRLHVPQSHSTHCFGTAATAGLLGNNSSGNSGNNSSSSPSRRTGSGNMQSVSTLFSSNHRICWQRSLCNYSQDNLPKAGDARYKECSASATQLDRSGRQPQDIPMRTFSFQDGAQHERPASATPDVAGCSSPAAPRLASASAAASSSSHQPKVVVCSGGKAFSRTDSHSSGLGCEKEATSSNSNSAVVVKVDAESVRGQRRESGSAGCEDCGSGMAEEHDPQINSAMTWSCHHDPYHLRHQGPSSDGHKDSMEMSVYQTNSSTPPASDSAIPSQGTPTSVHAASKISPAGCASQNPQDLAGTRRRDQSVSVLRTGGQSDSVSFVSNSTISKPSRRGEAGSERDGGCSVTVAVADVSDGGRCDGIHSKRENRKRKSSERTVRYSMTTTSATAAATTAGSAVQITPAQRLPDSQRRRSHGKDYFSVGSEAEGRGERALTQSHRRSGGETLSSDCPADTQPLLPVTRVRVGERVEESGSLTESPDMCADNALVRFHSLDGKDSSSKATAADQRMQRAISVGTTTNLSLQQQQQQPHSLSASGSGGLAPYYCSSSPTGSESLAAPPLNELYRYHVFLSHCVQDAAWVQEIVARLQAPPFSYKCAFSPVVEQDQASLEQSLLCSAMLSERVVLVLSKRYVQETWFAFEKVLRQLTQMSLHNQRIMGVLLEDCEIPDTLGELYFLDTSDPDFLDVFTKRLKTGRIPRSSESVSSDMAGRNSVALPSVVNGQILAQCMLAVKVGWDSFLQITEPSEELPPSLKSHGINLENDEFVALVENVCAVAKGSNQLPWVLCLQPLLALLLAAALWLPAFIAVLAVQVDDDTGMALPVRLVVFIFPLAIVSCGYLLKWRRRYWLSKMVRVLVQNCVKANQLLYCEGRPVLTTAGHVRANNFAVYFIYFDLTDCVRSVDLLLFTCLEDDWDKLMRLVEFYARDKLYLSQVSMSERLTVMTGAAYLFKLVRQVLPHPPQQRHVSGQLCLCQFTEECVTRFVHALDREDVGALAELFTRHLFGYVSGTAIHRINTEIFHRLQ